MMTADEILAAHATRRPDKQARPADAGRSADPWWKVSDTLGGDLRAFKGNREKEDTDAEKL